MLDSETLTRFKASAPGFGNALLEILAEILLHVLDGGHGSRCLGIQMELVGRTICKTTFSLVFGVSFVSLSPLSLSGRLLLELLGRRWNVDDWTMWVGTGRRSMD